MTTGWNYRPRFMNLTYVSLAQLHASLDGTRFDHNFAFGGQGSTVRQLAVGEFNALKPAMCCCFNHASHFSGSIIALLKSFRNIAARAPSMTR
jgi:hypothetical protein